MMNERRHIQLGYGIQWIATVSLALGLTVSISASHAATLGNQKKERVFESVMNVLQLKSDLPTPFVAAAPEVDTTQESASVSIAAGEAPTSLLRKIGTPITSTPQRSSNVYLNTLTNEEQARVRMLSITRKSIVSVVSTDPKNNIDEYLSRLSGIYQDYEHVPSGPRLAFSISQGSGFFITSTGLLATSKHVVANDKYAYRIVTSENKVYEVEKIIRDPLLDLAFIQIKNTNRDFIQPVNFLDKNTLPLVGQTVFSVGNTLGKYPNTVSQGIISEVSRTVTAYGEQNMVVNLFDMIQTDAAISQGNSGGPLLDTNGRVVGLNTAFDQDGENIGFSVPSTYVQAALDSYQRTGRIIKPFVGIQYIMLDSYMTKTYNIPVSNGAYVLQDDGASAGVLRGSPAEKVGISSGDIITKVNNISLSQNMTLMNAITKLRGEEKVTLTVFRAGKEFTVEIPLISVE